MCFQELIRNPHSKTLVKNSIKWKHFFLTHNDLDLKARQNLAYYKWSNFDSDFDLDQLIIYVTVGIGFWLDFESNQKPIVNL